CILCEGVTMQEMMASDNVGPEDDGNASVSAGEEALGRKAKRLGACFLTGIRFRMQVKPIGRILSTKPLASVYEAAFDDQ
ncbi:MAG: hypothetical protein K2G02_05590, partial [Phocaeicola sp.]|nr:hypothetical protein [Phocaeicola sp.]